MDLILVVMKYFILILKSFRICTKGRVTRSHVYIAIQSFDVSMYLEEARGSEC